MFLICLQQYIDRVGRVPKGYFYGTSEEEVVKNLEEKGFIFNLNANRWLRGESKSLPSGNIYPEEATVKPIEEISNMM